MHTYTAANLVTAMPMTLLEYTKYQVAETSAGYDSDEGFLVENPKGTSNHPNHKGSVSWVPHRVFLADHTLLEGADSKPAHEQRVLAELVELQKKLAALIAFTKTDKYLSLVFVDRNHLQAQCRSMSTYMLLLESRVARFKPSSTAV